MDEPHADVSLFRKASFTFWLLGALMLLVTLLVGFSLFGPNPPIEIGKATTRITTPLDANGLPDYAAVLLADSRKGVTPENNGAVPFLMAMWPTDREIGLRYAEGFTAEDAKLVCDELGLPGVPPEELRVTLLNSDKNRLATLRLLRERLPKPETFPEMYSEDDDLWGLGIGGISAEKFLNGLESNVVTDSRINSFLWRCVPMDRPWTAEDLPFLAEWLEENRTAIDLIVKGAERPEWHLPEPGLLRGGSGALVKSPLYRRVHQLRSAARLLTTRCRFHQGNGNYEEATRDALAILRLAHHLRKGPFLTNQVVATAIGGVGLRAVDRIVADQAMPVTMLHSLLEEFDSIGPFSWFASSIDQGGRFFALDTIVNLREATDFNWNRSGISAPFNLVSYDWNPSLRAINQHFDAVVAASKLPTWTGRQTAFAPIRAAAASSPPLTTREWIGLLTAKGRGQTMGSMWTQQLGTNPAIFFKTEERSLTQRQLTRLGIALAIHRAEQGAYPVTLDELVPGVLSKLPVDLFYKNPFVYRKTDDGFLLYCLGANDRDDRGSNEGHDWGGTKLEGVAIEDRTTIPAGADDLSLRAPPPAPEPWPWETDP